MHFFQKKYIFFSLRLKSGTRVFLPPPLIVLLAFRAVFQFLFQFGNLLGKTFNGFREVKED